MKFMFILQDTGFCYKQQLEESEDVLIIELTDTLNSRILKQDTCVQQCVILFYAKTIEVLNGDMNSEREEERLSEQTIIDATYAVLRHCLYMSNQSMHYLQKCQLTL